jgi:hypothetical protein
MMQPRHAVFTLVALAVVATSAAAQERPVKTIPYDGYDLFCHVLHSEGIKPILTMEDAASDPANTMIVVFGATRAIRDLHRVTDGLKNQYLAKGGSLLIATDHHLDDRRLGLHVHGMIVSVPMGLDAYHGSRACPLVRFAHPKPIKVVINDKAVQLDGADNAPDHPVFTLLHRGIATNCPSFLDAPFGDASLQDLLSFPFGGFAILQPEMLRGGVGMRYMVGSPKGAKPSGRALYIAGQGMFMNTMMVQTDNDNFQFATNAVRWLAETPQGSRRKKALFIVDGQIIDEFDKKLTPADLPLPIPPAKAIARLIRGLEDERFFHRALAGLLDQNLGRVVAILAGIGTFVLLLYGLKKFRSARSHVETAVPALLGPQPTMYAAAPAEERQQAILRQPDFWEEARFLVLKWFRQELEVTPHHWRAGVDARFRVAGSFLSHWRLSRRANHVLRLARFPDRRRVSRHDFFVLIETLRELSSALNDGRLALLVEGKNVRQEEPVAV